MYLIILVGCFHLLLVCRHKAVSRLGAILRFGVVHFEQEATLISCKISSLRYLVTRSSDLDYIPRLDCDGSDVWMRFTKHQQNEGHQVKHIRVSVCLEAGLSRGTPCAWYCTYEDAKLQLKQLGFSSRSLDAFLAPLEAYNHNR